MAEEKSLGLTEQFMRVTTSQDRNMVSDISSGLTAVSIKVNSKKIILRVQEYTSGTMEECLRELGS